MPGAAILVDRWPCDLCLHYRAGLPRATGVTFFDGFWACADCKETYAALVSGREVPSGARA
jgi:hypothetical protein